MSKTHGGLERPAMTGSGSRHRLHRRPGYLWRNTGLVFLTILLQATDLGAATLADARRHIKHVIIVMQENRSFDTYFGTFPGADGIPTDATGNFTVCLPIDLHNPQKGCVKPFHDTSLTQAGGPHTYANFTADRNNGRMNGFVDQQIAGGLFCRGYPKYPKCAGYDMHDVMGYHTDAEIPNYWSYARIYMLQDHLFEPVGQYSLGSHLMMISEWVANCSDFLNPLSCVTTNDPIEVVPGTTPFAWTNLTWLLDRAGVLWKYYLSQGGTPDCDDQDASDNCDPEVQDTAVPSIWNPLPGFTTFAENSEADPQYQDHLANLDHFYRDVAENNLPAVSWIVPSADVSEHPPYNVVDGMNYVTSLVNTIMQSRYYNNTVIFVAWDDWGGFYDHEDPPIVDRTASGQIFGYGFRVPGLVISPYVARHFDHQIVSFDAYNRFIEDIFLAKQRLDPGTDGRPDSRPDVREALATGYVNNKPVYIGDLLKDFDFSRAPIPPTVLSNTVPDE